MGAVRSAPFIDSVVMVRKTVASCCLLKDTDVGDTDAIGFKGSGSVSAGVT